MVRIELWHLVEFHPLHSVFFQQTMVVVLHVDKGAVGYGNYTFTRVTVNSTKGVYLFHIEISQSCEFEEHTVCGFVDAFFCADEPTIE